MGFPSGGFFDGAPPEFRIGFMIVIFGFIFVFGTIIVRSIRGAAVWSHNNQSPIETIPARIVSKRTEVSGGANDTSAFTHYYVTFEKNTGERIEVPMRGTDFGLFAEGDEGELTIQGTRYHTFRRYTR